MVTERSAFHWLHPSTILLLLLTLTTMPMAWALDPAREVKDYSVAQWGVTDGLPYPAIAAIAQSPDGYLWIGTRAGLSRFDGVTFTTYTRANLVELAEDRINALFTAHDGTLWIGTDRGIIWYRNRTWHRPSLGREIDQGRIVAIGETRDGGVLLATALDRTTVNPIPMALFRFRNGQCTQLHPETGETLDRVSAITVSVAGRVLIAGRCLYRLEGDKLVDIARELGFSQPQLLAAISGPAESDWIGGPLGLTQLGASEHRTFSTADGLPSNSIRSLGADRDGNLWVGTSSGLARYRDGHFQSLLRYGVESLSNVMCIYEDAERNLWVGTDNGLYRVSDVKVTTITQRDGLPVNSVLCVMESHDGSRWIGTIGGGLVHLSAAGIQIFHTRDGLKEDSVGALAEDSTGRIWMAYYTQGLGYFDGTRFTHFAPGSAVRFRGLAIAPDGVVWAASSNGLFRFNGDAFDRVPLDPQLDNPRALHVDGEGRVWVATGRAFGRLHNGTWKVTRDPAGIGALPHQNIFSDSAGSTWILQDGPTLIRVRGDHQERYTFPGLGPLVYSGFEHAGEIWISFRAGIARIPLKEFDAAAEGRSIRPAYTLFSESDGMRSRAPNNSGSPGSCAMSDGSLWFSTSIGVAIINPSQVRSNLLPPNVVIEQVLADRREYRERELDTVPPGRGEIAIRYTALSLTNPDLVRFKYRLHGFDAGWVDGGNAHEAHYGGLPPGTYRFEVTACNNEGVWNPSGATCAFTLLPHFYQQWWFFVAAGLAVAGTSFGIYGWRSRRLQKRARLLQEQNAELERRIAERTAELRQSYEALRSSEYFYHSLVESLSQAIVRKDASGRYTYANEAAGKLFGRPINQIVGRTDDDLFPAETAKKVREADKRSIEERQPLEYEEIVEREGARKRYLHIKRVPLVDEQNLPLGVQLLYWDMTAFRETEDRLRNAQRELIEISRLAGIAEMATGILHNLGNAVNSVKVAATVVRDKTRQSDVVRLRRVSDMLNTEKDRLPEFFATDHRGRKLPHYLTLLADHLEAEQRDILRELQHLGAGIEHVAQIIAAQQDGAKVTEVIEQIAPRELIEYVCRINQALLDRHEVIVQREFSTCPDVVVNRQKVLQILGNLVRNAIDSMVESRRPDKHLVVSARSVTDGTIEIAITDNGVGIPPDNLGKLFKFGFTTKAEGHGFGLHNSAIAAQEMGGELRVTSGGSGEGATFTLVLPLSPGIRGARETSSPQNAR